MAHRHLDFSRRGSRVRERENRADLQNLFDSLGRNVVRESRTDCRGEWKDAFRFLFIYFARPISAEETKESAERKTQLGFHTGNTE
jgi:hypothetical protein